MKPQALTASSFDKYPPLARAVAIQHLEQFKRLPVPVLASFLDRIIGWDWRFPAERDQLSNQLHALDVLPPADLRKLLQPFSTISLPSDVEALDWLNSPAAFLEHLTPHLWATRQIDGYRAAAKALIEHLSMCCPVPEPTTQRLVVVTCGEELIAPEYPLFSKLSKYGLHARKIDADGADVCIAELLVARTAKAHTGYAHWLLDGGAAAGKIDGATGNPVYLSYTQAEPVRRSVLKVMQQAVTSGWGPELLRSRLAALTPSDCHAEAVTPDPVLQHFIVDLFANGSGTQIYSTSFVQWSAREILRRAQPETVVLKVAARVRQRSLNDFLTRSHDTLEPDCAGSLIDADLAAYYTWLELENLPGARRSLFLVWFAGHRQAFLIGPGVPRNVSTADLLTLRHLLTFADFSV